MDLLRVFREYIHGLLLSSTVDWNEGVSTTYFRGLYDFVQKNRSTLPQQETWVQNQIDEIVQLIAETLYQLSLK